MINYDSHARCRCPLKMPLRLMTTQAAEKEIQLAALQDAQAEKERQLQALQASQTGSSAPACRLPCLGSFRARTGQHQPRLKAARGPTTEL
jgi:hypothetical protein